MSIAASKTFISLARRLRGRRLSEKKIEISLSQIRFRLALLRRPKRLLRTFTVTLKLKETTMPLCQTSGTFPAVEIPGENISSEDLELEHFTALHTMRSWQDIWGLFYNNLWFRRKLTSCVRKAARDGGLGPDCYDDIRQEALIEFAKALQRNCSLRFDLSKGTFEGFLHVVVYRSCLKGLRQFQRRHHSMADDDFMHPYYEEHTQLEKLVDFRHVADQIAEPYRGLVRQLLTGETVDSIAVSRKRSKRTIYRWIDRSVELLKQRYFEA